MSPEVWILSLGPGDPDLLNRKTTDILFSGKPVLLCTGRHPAAAWLRDKQIPFRTMDSLYDASEDFDALFSAVARDVWDTAAENGILIYAVADAMTDRSVDLVTRACPEDGAIHVVPGFSYYDYYYSACRALFPTADARVCPAADFLLADADPSVPLLITEVDGELAAGEVKNRLSAWLDDEEKVYFIDGEDVPRRICLYELDRQPRYSHMSAVAVEGRPFSERKKKVFTDLLRIMDRLRSRDGCPWDREQTHESLRPYVVEEAWETVDAIDAKDPDHLAEELGDLLFQVVFHTSVASSFDEFTASDVVTGICDKMIRRHPHVFGPTEGKTGTFTHEDWERIKRGENGARTAGESMALISAALPSLQYAQKIVRKLCAAVPGLSRSFEDIIASVHAAAEGIRDDGAPDSSRLLGRLLFCCAELAVRLGLDGEILLHETARTAVNAFRMMENKGKIDNQVPGGLTFNDFGI